MKKKNYKKIINKIENTRKKNNKNWMDILRLAFKSSPVEASKILSQIYKEGMDRFETELGVERILKTLRDLKIYAD